MSALHVLRVFVGGDGTGGNPLGVVLDGPAVAAADRQQLAARLGFSETVFVDDPVAGLVRIFTPATELGFAGHPLVGTGWLLARQGAAVTVLRPPAGAVPTWSEEGRHWIRARAEWAPQMTIRQYPSPAAVEALAGPPPGVGFLDAWAWEDREAGSVRVRVFAPDVGVDEDEATGAAAVRLTAHLRQGLRITQGVGSVLLTRLGAEATIEVGGSVVLDEIRDPISG